MTARWSEFRMEGVVPDELTSAAGSVSDTLGTVLDALSAAASAVDVAAKLQELELDVVRLATAAAVAVVDDALRLFKETSVNLLWAVPTSFRGALTPDKLLAQVGRSFLDESDPNRPQAVGEVSYLTFVLLATHPNVADVIEALSRILDLFGVPTPETSGPAPGSSRFATIFAGNQNLQRILAGRGGEKDPQPVLSDATVEGKDWLSVKLEDIAILGEVIRPIEQLADAMRPVNPVLTELAGIATARVEWLQAILANMNKAVQALQAVSEEWPALAAFMTSGTGTMEGIAATLAGANSVDGYPYGGTRSVESAGCLVVHVQSLDSAALTLIEVLLGTSFAGPPSAGEDSPFGAIPLSRIQRLVPVKTVKGG